MTRFFLAWAQDYSASSSIPTQSFDCDIRQERQFINWYVTPSDLEFARANPGQLYIIGDEPDQFCQSPIQYAQTYQLAVELLRNVDPTARFSPAGFAEPNGHCCVSQTYDATWDEAHSISYAQKFVDAYTHLFGVRPPVTEWRFHDFALTIPVGDIEAWWSRVEKMAAWSIANGAKMYLGSWGFHGWNEPDTVLKEQVKQMAARLLTDSRIVGAAWWSLEPWDNAPHSLSVDGALTVLGETYSELNTGTSLNGEKMTEQEEARLAAVEEILGIKHVGKTSEQLKAALIPENAVLNGRYPLFLSDFQIRLGIAKLETEVEKLK